MKPRSRLRAAVSLLALLLSSPTAADETVALWAELLEAHTRPVETTVGTVVDYRALLAEPAASKWRELLSRLSLAGALAKTEAEASRAERLALWINAYNILAIDTVLRHYPVESIRDAGWFISPVWSHEAGVVAGRKVSLGEIEHEILRPLGDPRIHAAIVCASTSCPSLRRRPFTAEGIEAQLDEAVETWLASPTKGLRVDRASRTVHLSRIFDWFEEDFEAGGGVLVFVAGHAPLRERAWLRENAGRIDVEHFGYDWSLNDAR